MTGARPFEVIGGAVVLRTTAGSSQYLYKGAPFDASAFTEASVEHALSSGLVAEVDVVDEIVSDDPNGEPINIVGTPIEPGAAAGSDAVIVPEGAEGVEVPEGAPERAWTHAQIDAWAARQSPPIALVADSSKDEKLAAIASINP